MKNKRTKAGILIISAAAIFSAAILFAALTGRQDQKMPVKAGAAGHLARNWKTVRTVAAYIKDIKENRITVDVIEYVTDFDVARKKELIEELESKGMPTYVEDNGNFMDGYFIYNADKETTEWHVLDKTVYFFIDWNGDYTGSKYTLEYLTTDISIFDEYSKGYVRDDPTMPFFFEVAGETVISVRERFIP